MDRSFKGLVRGWQVAVDTVGPSFPADYFPRRFHYKKDALNRAEEARRGGCTNVRVEKVI